MAKQLLKWGINTRLLYTKYKYKYNLQSAAYKMFRGANKCQNVM